MVVACALPAGFLVVRNEALSPDLGMASPLFALLSVVVVGAPIAVVLSLMGRVFARKLLRRRQQQGRSIRHVVVAGSSAAAQQLTERIQGEPHAGMKMIGLCLPSEELPRPVVDGIPVLGNLDQVADVAHTVGCDAVAVTSDDATRHSYLRKLAWSLEGAEVELLVDPGLEEVAGPRLQSAHTPDFRWFTWQSPISPVGVASIKRVGDVVLTSFGLVVIAPSCWSSPPSSSCRTADR